MRPLAGTKISSCCDVMERFINMKLLSIYGLKYVSFAHTALCSYSQQQRMFDNGRNWRISEKSIFDQKDNSKEIMQKLVREPG